MVLAYANMKGLKHSVGFVKGLVYANMAYKELPVKSVREEPYANMVD
jgi:hypothetical protein